MGFFFFDSTPKKEVSDRQAGLDALQVYYNNIVDKHGVSYSFNEMIQKMDAKNKSFVAGFGLGIKLVKPSQSKLNSSMANVANISKGQMPKNLNVFQESLSKQLQKIELEDLKNVTTSTVADIEKVAKVAVSSFGLYKFLSIAVPLLIWWDSRRKK